MRQSRREFIHRMTAAGAAMLAGFGAKPVAAEPPPRETRTEAVKHPYHRAMRSETEPGRREDPQRRYPRRTGAQCEGLGLLRSRRHRRRTLRHCEVRSQDAVPERGWWSSRLTTMPELLAELDALLVEHRRCGRLNGDVDGVWVWMACECGPAIMNPMRVPQIGKPKDGDAAIT